MIIKLDKNGSFPISKLKKFLDISRISFYTIKETNNNIHIKFYDSKKELIPLKEKEQSDGKNIKKPKG